MFYKLLNSPQAFSLFLKFFGDRNIVSEIIKKELEIRDDSAILDGGCGTGYFSLMFPYKGYIGVDFNEDYINFAKKKYNRNFKRMDAVNLQFDDNYFDIVFVNGMLHHLQDDILAKVLSEIKRVLKPGGHALIIEVSYVLGEDSKFKRFLRRLDRGKYIKEFNVLRQSIRDYFSIAKAYVNKEGPWCDNAVFLVKK